MIENYKLLYGVGWFDVPTFAGASNTAATEAESSGDLTIEKLQEAIDLICPPLYYATDKNIEPGDVYLLKETEFYPEFIVCHPDDFETLRSEITARRLVHIKDEPRENAMKRFVRIIDTGML